MKKSFMSNIKSFVDSNVRQRIDRVAHNYSEPLSDDLLLVERQFEDIRQVCIDADKKISALLQSIQLSSNPSQLGAYTQNVQAGLNNLSHNLSLQTTSLATSVGGGNNSTAPSNGEQNEKGSQNPLGEDSKVFPASNSAQQLRPGATNSQTFEQLSEDFQLRYKKLPVVGFYKFLVKSNQKLKPDSLLAKTISQCSQLQIQLTNLYLTHERLIETKCLKPIQHMLEVDIPNVIKLRKLFIKSHNDYEFLKTRYNGASLKQQQQLTQQTAQPAHFSNTSYLISQNSIPQTNTNKLDQLKSELDEAVTRFEQAKDNYEAELYGFVCRETELVNLLRTFYQIQTEYHIQVGKIMQGLMPTLSESLALTPRKPAFGVELAEHLRCTGREISPVIELCTHFLHLQGLDEEGLFRIPGSSIKIKKLKNGINAWFLSLASLEELESDLKQQSGHHCINALYDLFKTTIGQQINQSQMIQHSSVASNSAVTSTLAVDEFALSQTNFHAEGHDDDEMVLDVHSVAGLLKLYLRELPEPLCTFALYDEWIRCVDSKSDSSCRLDSISAVIKQLPATHRANLRHLIKFLHNLTLNQEQNKMNSTNLAIAMGPSLMWPKPVESSQQNDNNSDDAQSLNMQMSTFGISASHHAMILETLINNADTLFPGSCDFTLPGFDYLKLGPNKSRSSGRLRATKSTSPTGLSTTSSSSFSSNASNPTSPQNAVKGHGRKGGSMEGLLGGQEVNTLLQGNLSSNRFINRPVSVQIQREEYSAGAKSNQRPPSKPPVPLLRSQSKQASCDEQSIQIPPKVHNKPPAPPVPPPTTARHHLERIKAANAPKAAPDSVNSQKPRPVSLRGTGTIDQVGGSSSTPVTGHTVPRPTVPPPARPELSNKSALDKAGPEKSSNSDQLDAIGAEGLRCGKLEPGEGNNTTLTEAPCSKSSSVVPSGGVSDGGSSFDNDSESQHSLEQSWSRRSVSNGSSSEVVLADATASNPADHQTAAVGINKDTSNAVQSSEASAAEGNAEQDKRPPIKPPRSVSPKMPQSTPL